MKIVPYLAMTAAEFQKDGGSFPQIGWMACHFSPYGTGLSNLPPALPKGSLLILNDRTPVFGHDPQQIAAQLAQIVGEQECCGILLDLQRPKEVQTAAIVEAVTELEIPIGVTPSYSDGNRCSVFLPPVPLTTLPKEYLAPWADREIWLEIATERCSIRVTQQGSNEIHCPDRSLPYPHTDDQLHCRYGMEVAEDHIDFHLQRDLQQLSALMEEMQQLGVTKFIGLYQQLGSSFSQAIAQRTAFFQP